MPENPDYWGFKSYEPYYLITAQSVQLCLQYDAVTDSNGFRLLDGRYLVAVGTFCNAPCGTYIDLILENGVLIPCIVGDIKADVHTGDTHAYTRASMCASEFIIDDEICPVAWSGDISTMYEEWKGKVESIRVYQSMDRAAMEETFKNMYQIGYEAALKEGAVELNTDKLRAEIGQIKGIGENRLNEIMAVIESNLKSE